MVSFVFYSFFRISQTIVPLFLRNALSPQDVVRFPFEAPLKVEKSLVALKGLLPNANEFGNEAMRQTLFCLMTLTLDKKKENKKKDDASEVKSAIGHNAISI